MLYILCKQVPEEWDLAVADLFSSEVLSLPVHIHLHEHQPEKKKERQ